MSLACAAQPKKGVAQRDVADEKTGGCDIVCITPEYGVAMCVFSNKET